MSQFAPSYPVAGPAVQSSVLVVEPRVDIKENNQLINVVLRGAKVIDEKVYPSTSYSPTNVSWSQNTPSVKYVVDRNIYSRWYIQLDFKDSKGAAVAPNLGIGDGLRSWPIQSCIQTLEEVLNGQSFSVNPQEYNQALLRYNNWVGEQNLDYSLLPAQQDQYINYSDSLAGPALGSARNVFCKYGENSAQASRGAFLPESITNAGSTLKYVITEPLLISPNLPGKRDDQGYINLNRWEVNVKFGDLSRMWSSSSDPAQSSVASVAVTFYQAPELLFRYLTPIDSYQKPYMTVLPYYKPFQFTRQVVLASGVAPPISTDTVQLSQIPEKFYFFLQPSLATRTFKDTDTFARIKSITVNWDNQVLFSNATEQQLYQMSRENGINCSWNQWKSFTGSVLCIAMGKDIGLPETEAPGIQSQHTIQATLTVENLYGSSTTFDFYMLPVYVGSAEFTENSCRAITGTLTPSQVMSAMSNPAIDYRHYRMYEMLNGGSLFSSLKNIINKVASGVRTGVTYGRKVLPFIAALNPSYGASAERAIDMADRVARLAGHGRGAGYGAGYGAGRPVLRRIKN